MSEPQLDGGVIRREFPVELEQTGDGRTLDVRIVPYNVPTRVADPPENIPYDEMWVEGAFDKQLNAANRVSVFVNVEHEQGIGGIVGRGSHLREVPGDGLHGTFRMLDHPDADKALQLVKDGDLTGVSLEFVPLKSVRENGIVKRMKARLVNIALVRPSGSTGGIQAYKDAGVLAVREQPLPEPEPDPEPEPTPEPEPQMVTDSGFADEILERVGIERMLTRSVTDRPWDGSPARFTDEQYQRSCLIDRSGEMPPKQRCSLPVLEPDGTVNSNALGAAASALAGGRGGLANVSGAEKASAARKLVRYYGQAKMDPPASLRAIAAR